MAKITISDITAAFGSNTAINAKFQQVEDALNNDVLYRNNPVGESNTMSNDLDMAGYNILNATTVEIVDAVSWATEWANKAEDSLVSADAGGDEVDDYSSLHHSAKANAQRILAEDAKTAAEVAQVGAELAYDDFDDRYLGAYATNPTTDNDGVPLDASDDGIEYWDSTLKVRKTWNGGTLTWGLTSTSIATNAVDVDVADSGGYYTGTDTEAVLQEVGASSGFATTAIDTELNDLDRSANTPTSFVPTLYGSTVAGTPTMSSASGYYTRIGNLCHITIDMTITAIGGMTGSLRIGNMPFTAASNSQSVAVATILGLGGSVAATDNITIAPSPITTYLGLSYTNPLDTTSSTLTVTDITTNFAVVTSFVYVVAP